MSLQKRKSLIAVLIIQVFLSNFVSIDLWALACRSNMDNINKIVKPEEIKKKIIENIKGIGDRIVSIGCLDKQLTKDKYNVRVKDTRIRVKLFNKWTNSATEDFEVYLTKKNIEKEKKSKHEMYFLYKFGLIQQLRAMYNAIYSCSGIMQKVNEKNRNNTDKEVWYSILKTCPKSFSSNINKSKVDFDLNMKTEQKKKNVKYEFVKLNGIREQFIIDYFYVHDYCKGQYKIWNNKISEIIKFKREVYCLLQNIQKITKKEKANLKKDINNIITYGDEEFKKFIKIVCQIIDLGVDIDYKDIIKKKSDDNPSKKQASKNRRKKTKKITKNGHQYDPSKENNLVQKAIKALNQVQKKFIIMGNQPYKKTKKKVSYVKQDKKSKKIKPAQTEKVDNIKGFCEIINELIKMHQEKEGENRKKINYLDKIIKMENKNEIAKIKEYVKFDEELMKGKLEVINIKNDLFYIMEKFNQLTENISKEGLSLFKQELENEKYKYLNKMFNGEKIKSRDGFLGLIKYFLNQKIHQRQRQAGKMKRGLVQKQEEPLEKNSDPEESDEETESESDEEIEGLKVQEVPALPSRDKRTSYKSKVFPRKVPALPPRDRRTSYKKKVFSEKVPLKKRGKNYNYTLVKKIVEGNKIYYKAGGKVKISSNSYDYIKKQDDSQLFIRILQFAYNNINKNIKMDLSNNKYLNQVEKNRLQIVALLNRYKVKENNSEYLPISKLSDLLIKEVGKENCKTDLIDKLAGILLFAKNA